MTQATKKDPKKPSGLFGAGNQNRTDDLVITNDVLYRLSHTSDFIIISLLYIFVNTFLKKYFKILEFF